MNKEKTKLGIAFVLLSGILLIVSSLLVSALHSSGEDIISFDKATAIALQHVEGDVEEIELVTEDDQLLLAVELEQDGEEYEVKLNAYTGEVFRVEHEQDIDDSTVTVKVSREYAAQVALSHVDGQVTEIEATKINDQLYYEVEVQQELTESDVLVDMVTGRFVRVETSDLEEDDDED